MTVSDSEDSLTNGVPGPLVLVPNEIGLGVSPLSAEARRFVDVLGSVHSQVAAACNRVTRMVAGCALAVKQELE